MKILTVFYFGGWGIRTGKTAMEEGGTNGFKTFSQRGGTKLGMSRMPKVMGRRPTKPPGVARMKGA